MPTLELKGRRAGGRKSRREGGRTSRREGGRDGGREMVRGVLLLCGQTMHQELWVSQSEME